MGFRFLSTTQLVWLLLIEQCYVGPVVILELAEMITIDKTIERLQELRRIAPQGGETAVVIKDFENDYETAVFELMPVVVKCTHDDIPVVWENRDENNTHQVVRVF